MIILIGLIEMFLIINIVIFAVLFGGYDGNRVELGEYWKNYIGRKVVRGYIIFSISIPIIWLEGFSFVYWIFVIHLLSWFWLIFDFSYNYHRYNGENNFYVGNRATTDKLIKKTLGNYYGVVFKCLLIIFSGILYLIFDK